jgi:hypothetical protein
MDAFGFDACVLSALNGHYTRRPTYSERVSWVGCAIASLVNPQQVLPGAEITVESQTLRNLVP